ncbi:hypothetical protein Aglo03_42100 [Actinokineospora globicatena]|uniref:Oxidoreductase n=1 Tax=Actinokineospora globicatena TaxID=103729 RepID=A0A9W6VAW9_9PSEU|nr:hypothetical protein Aglo03_42100 [Actinokineospora globicatena]
MIDSGGVSESRTAPVIDDLSEWEQEVVDAALRGTWAQPDITMGIEGLAITQDPGVLVRADLIRELLLGRHGDIDPRGLRIRGVRVVGRLDLDHISAEVGLALVDCVLSDGLSCNAAQFGWLSLAGSRVAGLRAPGLRTKGNLVLDGATVRGEQRDGAVSLRGAEIGGQLVLDLATIINRTGPAISADDIRLSGGFLFRDATVRGAGNLGSVRLHSAQIDAPIEMHRTTITNDTGPALLADNLRAGSYVLLERAFLRGGGAAGAIHLVGASVGGRFSLDEAVLINRTGPSLEAAGMRVDGNLLARAASFLGSIELFGAHITGQLGLDRATVTSRSSIRPAVEAEGLRTGGHVLLRDAEVHGANRKGTIRLHGAHVGRQLELERSTVTYRTGPGLSAEGLRVDGHLLFRDALLIGADSEAVRLNSAHVGGQATFERTEVVSTSGILLSLTEMQVAGALFLPARLVCTKAAVHPARRGCPDQDRALRLSGLTFPALSAVTWREWLHLVRYHTKNYRPQPYQQLAAVERSAGHDSNARRVLIAQQDDLRRRTPESLGGVVARWRHVLWGWVGRYGYRAHRIVSILMVVLALAGTLGYVAGQISTRPDHRAAERVVPATTPATTPGIPCSTAELIGLGIDRGLPLGATGLRARCDLDTGTRWGQAFTYAIWVLQALLWALATLAIAAYTGLVRKPG